MKKLINITLIMILVLSTNLFAQVPDSSRTKNKDPKKNSKSVRKTLLKDNKEKKQKINFDRFIDMDGDGISDSRGKGFGLRNRLLLDHQKNIENKKRNRGGKNGKK